MSSILARMKKIETRATTTFPPLYVYGDFSRCSRAGHSAVQDRMWPNLKLMRDLVVVIITCKNEEDPIKNEGASVAQNHMSIFQTLKGR